MGFALVFEFIEHLQIVTTSNYCVFTGCLVVASNDVLCFCAHILTGWRLCHNCRFWTRLHSTNWTHLGQSSDIASEQTHREHHVATLLPAAALLLLRDITTDAGVTCSSVACAVIVISCLLCCDLLMALYMLQYRSSWITPYIKYKMNYSVQS
jgi:hypothetical protein